MKHKVKSSDFNFKYIRSNYSKKDAIQNGFKQLTGKELRKKIVNKTVFGNYLMGFKFIADIYENGKVEGLNHVGSHDFGSWMIDMEEHTLTLKWNKGWIDTITHAYEVNGTIEFFDVDTGKWRTTFNHFSPISTQK